MFRSNIQIGCYLVRGGTFIRPTNARCRLQMNLRLHLFKNIDLVASYQPSQLAVSLRLPIPQTQIQTQNILWSIGSDGNGRVFSNLLEFQSRCWGLQSDNRTLYAYIHTGKKDQFVERTEKTKFFAQNTHIHLPKGPPTQPTDPALGGVFFLLWAGLLWIGLLWIQSRRSITPIHKKLKSAPKEADFKIFKVGPRGDSLLWSNRLFSKKEGTTK